MGGIRKKNEVKRRAKEWVRKMMEKQEKKNTVEFWRNNV